MSHNIQKERQQAHALLDHLPDTQVPAVRGLLEAMLYPVSLALPDAPGEDEEITEEEERAAAQAREWLKHNKPIPHEEVLAEFGLTMDDFQKMGHQPLPPDVKGTDR